MDHVLIENSRGFFAPFLVAYSHWQDFYSTKILSTYGLSLNGHLPVSLFTFFLAFCFGNHPVDWLYFGLMQVWKPIVNPH
jgi:hypothetical protein